MKRKSQHMHKMYLCSFLLCFSSFMYDHYSICSCTTMYSICSQYIDDFVFPPFFSFLFLSYISIVVEDLVVRIIRLVFRAHIAYDSLFKCKDCFFCCWCAWAYHQHRHRRQHSNMLCLLIYLHSTHIHTSPPTFGTNPSQIN